MALIAFLLGAGIGWLFHYRWQRHLAQFGDNETKIEEARQQRKEWIFWWLLAFIVISAVLLFCAFQARYAGRLASFPSRLLYILTLPQHFTAIASLVLGVLIVLVWDKLEQFFHSLIAPRRRKSKREGAAGEDGDQEKPKRRISMGRGSDDVARQTYPWLTGIIGIAAVTLVAIITLVIFFPDVLTRVESIKVAGVEARFVSPAQVSGVVSGAASRGSADQPSSSPVPAYLFSVTGWRGIGGLFDGRVEQVRQRFLQKAAGAGPDQGKQKQDLARDFLKWHADPLSELLGCHLSDVGNIHEPIIRSKLALLANSWSKVALRRPRDQNWKNEFSAVAGEHVKFIVALDKELAERGSTCASARRDAAYFGDPYTDLMKRVAADPDAVLSNGYAIAFFASMIAFGQSSARAADFMNGMEAILDTADEAIIGRLNFYYNRSNARYYAEPWDFATWKPDIDASRQIALRIAERLKDADKKDGVVQPSQLERYFRFLVAQYTNDALSGYARDWQRGRRLSAQDVLETAALAKSLHEWLDKQSLPLFMNRGVEIAWIRGALVMGGAYDTLALYELMAAASKSPFAKESCDRGIALLSASKRVWDTLLRAQTIDGDGYLSVISVYNAHLNAFANSCPS